MRTGVTLLIDEASRCLGRATALYEIKTTDAASGAARSAPGVWGTIAEGAQPETSAPQRSASARRGCRPLISVNDVKNVGIMGYGVIDGRGYAKILHKDYSWWEMARKADPKNERYFTSRMIVANHADGLVLYRNCAAQLDKLPCQREWDEWIYGVGSASADAYHQGYGHGWDRSRFVDQHYDGS
jgi:polygalacturonase